MKNPIISAFAVQDRLWKGKSDKLLGPQLQLHTSECSILVADETEDLFAVPLSQCKGIIERKRKN